MKQKLYCYVHESGQDARSEYFFVVAVLTESDQQTARDALMLVERASGIGLRKWHKAQAHRRLKYIQLVMERRLLFGDIYFGMVAKPIPYFLPILDVIEGAIRQSMEHAYTVTVTVDGIDRKKIRELTNALRLHRIAVHDVRSRRDESEPLIRLADRWVGCIRSATEGRVQEKKYFEQALKSEHIFRTTKAPFYGAS